MVRFRNPMRAKDLLLVLVSTLVGLLLWEAGLRLFTHYGPHDAAQQASVPAKPPDVADAARYIRRLCRIGLRPAPPSPPAFGISNAAGSSARRRNMSGTVIW